jgi:hypothetical protein
LTSSGALARIGDRRTADKRTKRKGETTETHWIAPADQSFRERHIAMRRRSALILLTASSALFGAALLAFHHIPEGTTDVMCGKNFGLPFGFRIVWNCDSDAFMNGALDPGMLLEPNSARQSRPGLILAAAVLADCFGFLLSQVHALLPTMHISNWTMTYGPAYAAYLLLNFVVLNASLLLFLHILPEGDALSPPVVLLGLLLISNDVVKAFLLTPHTTLLNIFIPLFCLWAYGVASGEANRRDLKIALLAVVAGLGVTAYAAFSVFVPAVVIPDFLRLRHNFSWRRTVLTFGRAVVVTAVVALPMVLWIAYVVSRTGSFYQREIALFHQVVWILDAMRQGIGTVVVELAANAMALIKHDLPSILFVVVYSGVIAVLTGPRPTRAATIVRSVPAGVPIVSGLFIVFWSFVSLTDARIAFSAVPPLYAGAAWALGGAEWGRSRRRDALASLVAAFMIVMQVICELRKVGPFA